MMMGLLVDEPRGRLRESGDRAGCAAALSQSESGDAEIGGGCARLDLQVATWTVDEPEMMRAVAAAGVDGIMTNFPDRLQTVLEES